MSVSTHSQAGPQAGPQAWAAHQPTTPDEWVARAEEVATQLSVDALARDRANRTPYAEVQLLKDSGLVSLLGPVAHGGAGQTWSTANRVIRAVSAGDGSIGQLIGYHYLWAWAVRLVGTPDQIAAVEEQATREQWFFGGAVNPRDGDLVITERDGQLFYNGRKSFSTGGRVSDVTVLEGVLEGTDDHIFAIVPTQQDGLRFAGDWDNLGQRLTESGSVEIVDVPVDWSGAAGYVDKVFQPRVYNTLNVPLIQLIFANIYLGIAEGALTTATTYTREKTRAWPYAGDVKERAQDEFYVVETYGALQSRLWAAEALTERAGGLIDRINEHADTVTEQERGEAAVVIAAAKQVAIEVGLEIANRIFEVTGARATANSVGLDIFWRNLRTHSLHDPIAHKRAEVGRYALLGELPCADLVHLRRHTMTDNLREEFAPLFERIAAGAVARELDATLPTEQVHLLKENGFGAVRIPEEYGGRGASLPELTQLWIDLAAADANLPQALRGHFALAEDRLYQHLRGDDQEVWFKRFASGEIGGNAWSEVGSTTIDTQQTVLTQNGSDWRLNGTKYYTTGTIFAEWADVYALREDGEFVIALTRTDQPGFSVTDDWDGFGQRGTGSGTATFVDVHVADEDVLVFTDRFPYQTALYQLNLLATLSGIGRAALTDVIDQVRRRERNYSHANAARVRDDAQVLARVGEISSAVYAAEATTLRVATALQDAFEAVGEDEATILAINERAEIESSAAQVVVTDLVLKATSDLFDTLGASATSRGKALDRHWRNARTVSSHNPRILKARVVGGFEVNGTPPPYAWAIGTTQREEERAVAPVVG